MSPSLSHRLAQLFAALPQVGAVALGGSMASGLSDETSDLDLYVFTNGEIPLSERQALVSAAGGASRADLGLNYWGPGDQWFDAQSGVEVDVVYFDCLWFEGQLRLLLEQHQPAAGYTTCLWHIGRTLRVLHDPQGWLGWVQQFCQQPYPEPLRRAIIHHNQPLLATIIPAWRQQLKKALERHDLVSLNHRLAALLASYFDILFALNRHTHPGEKRLLSHVHHHCPLRPEGMVEDLQLLLAQTGSGQPELLETLDRVLMRLDQLLVSQLLLPLPSSGHPPL